MIAITRVSAKGRTTIPKAVRAALRVEPGDLIAWEVGADRKATVRRAQPADIECPRAVNVTFSEWSGAADEKAYRDL